MARHRTLMLQSFLSDRLEVQDAAGGGWRVIVHSREPQGRIPLETDRPDGLAELLRDARDLIRSRHILQSRLL